jgi:hypothetical protein
MMIHKIILLFLAHNVQLLRCYLHHVDNQLITCNCYIIFHLQILVDIDLIAIHF